jgi:arylsulfatase A-like enzyme
MNARRASPDASGSPSPGLHWFLPMIVWALLLVIAVFSKPFDYGAMHLLMLAELYVLLALLVHLAALLALRGGRLAGLVAAAGVGLVLALHLREQTRPSGTAESLDKPEVLASFVAVWAAATLLYFAALWWLRPRPEQPPAAVLLLFAVPFFLGAMMLSYYGSNTFRWHLLRHNVLLGALAHHLFAEDTATVRAALWERDATSSVPPREPPAPLAGEALQPEPGGASQPDIVFVLIDTLRADALAATGGAGGLMPFVDGLASESLVFTDVKVNASWTFPSMASFFTGLLPEEHGAVWHSTLGEDQLTIAEVMAARGYRTAAFVANGAWMRAERGMAQGFDLFHQLGTGGAAYPPAEHVNAAVFDWLDGATVRPDAPGAGPPDGEASAGEAGLAERSAAETTSPTGRPAADRPLFLYVHYMDPHVPYLSAGIVDPAAHDEARAGHESELRYLDGHIAGLLEGLAQRRAGAAWTLITADHGEEFGEHGERGHGRTLYDEALRVPALLRFGHAGGGDAVAADPARAEIDELAANAARVETDGEVAAIGARAGTVDAPLEGRDFFSLLSELSSGQPIDVPAWAEAHARSERYASTYYTNTSLIYRWLRPYRAAICLQAIEKDGYTLIWSGQGDTYELYDLRVDPGQHRNIADHEPETVNRLASAMRGAPAFWTPQIRGTLDEAALERLRALGYLR